MGDGTEFSCGLHHQKKSSWAALSPVPLSIIPVWRDLESADPPHLVERGVMPVQLVANDYGRSEGGLQRATDVSVFSHAGSPQFLGSVGLSYGDFQACDLLPGDLRSSIAAPSAPWGFVRRSNINAAGRSM